MSHILSGRCLAKIDWKSADPSNLTALCYNEVSLALALMAGRSVCSVRACLTAPCPRVRQERGDIITGNTQGLLDKLTFAATRRELWCPRDLQAFHSVAQSSSSIKMLQIPVSSLK